MSTWKCKKIHYFSKCIPTIPKITILRQIETTFDSGVIYWITHLGKCYFECFIGNKRLWRDETLQECQTIWPFYYPWFKLYVASLSRYCAPKWYCNEGAQVQNERLINYFLTICRIVVLYHSWRFGFDDDVK